MSFIEGPIRTGGTYSDVLQPLARPVSPITRSYLRDGSAIQHSTAPGTDHVQALMTISDVDNRGSTVTKTQQVTAHVLAPGPQLYEPVEEMDEDPSAFGWIHPVTGLRWLDAYRCTAGPGATPQTAEEWFLWNAQEGEREQYQNMRACIVAPFSTSVNVEMFTTMYTTAATIPGYATYWEVGVPAATHLFVGLSGETALAPSDLGTAIDGDTHLSVPSTSAPSSFPLTWPPTDVPGWGPVMCWAVRFTGLPVDLATAVPRSWTYVNLGFVATAVAPRTPYRLLYWVESPTLSFAPPLRQSGRTDGLIGAPRQGASALTAQLRQGRSLVR